MEKSNLLKDLQQDVLDLQALLKYGEDSLTDEIIKKQAGAILLNFQNNLQEYLCSN